MEKSKLNQKRKKRQAKQTDRNWIQKTTDACEGFFLDIFDAIGLYKLVDLYLKKHEAMRYLVFGALTTVVNLIVFAICDKPKVLPVLVSNTIAWVFAVFFAYITNRYCVFNSKKSNIRKEITDFVISRLTTLGIETVFMWATVDLLHWHSFLMKVISNIVVIILNFILSKLFVFKKSDEA